jgi:hypothetical protein
MFPHTITIYHHFVEDGTDAYNKMVLDGCYWNRKASQAGAGKGTEKTDSYTVITSPEQTARYGVYWEAYAGDRVIKGSGPDITSWKDLKGEVMVVRVVEENICGSGVDNITLTG